MNMTRQLYAQTSPAGLPRRLVSLYAGLVLFGVSLALMVSSQLGLDPWNVFHQGVARRTGVPLGVVVIAVSVAVLVAWIPLRERPGLGTLSNALLVGLVLEVTLALLREPDHLAVRFGFLLAGIVANGAATGLYIGAGWGSGPRDGLMTGLARRGRSIRVVRATIELSVLTVGWWLGGAVGSGTLLYAVAIGPLCHWFIPRLDLRRTDTRRAAHV